MFSKEDLILGTAEFNYETTLMTNISLQWEAFIDSLLHGRCQRLRNTGNMLEGKYLKIFLNSTFFYRIYIHDPNFHVTSLNPSGTPRLDLPLNFEGQKLSSFVLYIYAEKHKFLNRKSSQCYDYEKAGSSFTACIAEFVSNETKCKVSLMKRQLHL